MNNFELYRHAELISPILVYKNTKKAVQGEKDGIFFLIGQIQKLTGIFKDFEVDPSWQMFRAREDWDSANIRGQPNMGYNGNYIFRTNPVYTNIPAGDNIHFLMYVPSEDYESLFYAMLLRELLDNNRATGVEYTKRLKAQKTADNAAKKLIKKRAEELEREENRKRKKESLERSALNREERLRRRTQQFGKKK